MDIEEALRKLQDAGLVVKTQDRLGNDTGWQIRFETGEIVNLFDNGTINTQGQNQGATREILGIDAPTASSSPTPRRAAPAVDREVFVVYGHDHEVRTQLEAMLRRWDLTPLILDQLPSEGQTVIEKLETYAHKDVRFGVVLATPDDEGYAAGLPGEKKFRSRQNVVLELGMLFSTLGRPRVAILLKDNPEQGMERPSDIQGVIELRFRKNVEEVKVQLAKEMAKQGLVINVGKL